MSLTLAVPLRDEHVLLTKAADAGLQSDFEGVEIIYGIEENGEQVQEIGRMSTLVSLSSEFKSQLSRMTCLESLAHLEHIY